MSAEPLCRSCAAEGRAVAAVELDHIRPLHRGGDAIAPDNLQPLCRPCHEAKTLAERPPADKRPAAWKTLVEELRKEAT